MAGKSLDDIWRQMQAQRAAEQQARIAQERALYEQRERARQEYLQRMRMYEFASPTPASTAPGAGAGSGGGRLPVTNEDYPELIEQSLLIHWVDATSDEWKIVIYNYDTGVLSDIINTELIYDTGNEWYLYREDYTVHNKGFTFVLRNNVTSKYKIFFINPDGTLVAEKDLDTNEDFQYTENAIIYLGELDGVSTCYHYDGSNVRTHTFPDVNINLIEVDDASGEDVTRDGTILIEAPNNLTYYLGRPNGDLIDVSSYLGVGGTGNIRMDYNMSFITKYTNDFVSFKIVSEEGTLSADYDLTQHSVENINNVVPYGQNSVFVDADNGLNTRLFLSYDGDSNIFTALTFSTAIAASVIDTSIERSYYTPRPKSGNHIAVANYNYSSSDSLGYIVDKLNLWWLPKGETSFLNYDFESNIGTVSFIEGFDNFTGNRIFTKGENPIVMFSTGAPNDILVGFMTTNGFATQSTGVLYASCSNIWGGYLGESSFAVFDVGSDRIWQIYGENSILDETLTSSNWSWGSFGESVNRKGTLCVLDGNDSNQSFIWTEEVGLQAGPTGTGDIWNINSFAIRNYESYSEQIISQYITGQEGSAFVEGFHLLRLSGLSSRVIFPWGSTGSYTINEASVCREILYFNLTENGTSNTRVLVYKKSDLSLIEDYNPGNSTFFSNVIDNRVYITEDSSPLITYRLIGHLGVEVLVINATTYGQESNDAEDNDV